MPEFLQNALPAISTWLFSSGLRIAVILLGAYLVKRFGRAFIERIVRRIVVSDHFLTPEAERKREDTLIHIFSGSLRVLVWIAAGLVILSELGVNIGPLIAAAGIAGLAFGFGGQYLIRDLIAGLFLILENQFRVGDVVCLDGTCGLVEDVSLRMTVLRDLDGTVHHVPNGTFAKSANLSKHFARVNLNVGVSYNAKLEQVIAVVNRVGKELAEDPAWKGVILKPPAFLRVDDFGDSAVIVKILGETQPLKQWDVAGEFRKRLKIAFDREEIEIPFPQRVVHYTPERPSAGERN